MLVLVLIHGFNRTLANTNIATSYQFLIWNTGITLTLIVQFIFHHTGILSQPSFCASINDAEFTFECMLAIVESAFTNDLRRVWGLCDLLNPYHTSRKGHFRTHWDVSPIV